MKPELRQRFLKDIETVQKGRETKATALDVFFAYRLLLQRYPEFDDVDAYRIRSGNDLNELVAGVIESLEFQRLWRREQPWAPDRIVMGEHAGLRFFFNLRDRAIGLAILSGQFEPDMERLVRQLVKPGMRCVDVGANLGFFSILMGKLTGSGGRVYSLEPFPQAFALLERNIEENDLRDVIVSHQLAAHNKNSTASMCYRSDDGNDNFGSMFVPYDEGRFEDSHASLEVQCRRVDDVIEPDEQVDVVKIDIEGAERYALEGMQRILEESRPVLLVELNEYCLENMGQTSVRQVLATIAGHRYIPYDSRTFLGPTRAPYVFKKPESKYEFTNLICLPVEKSVSTQTPTPSPESGSNGSVRCEEEAATCRSM